MRTEESNRRETEKKPKQIAAERRQVEREMANLNTLCDMNSMEQIRRDLVSTQIGKRTEGNELEAKWSELIRTDTKLEAKRMHKLRKVSLARNEFEVACNMRTS